MVCGNYTHTAWNPSNPPIPDVVQELGSAHLSEHDTKILRGPYFAYGYLFATQYWQLDHQSQTWSYHDRRNG